jgi:protein SCO1/2
LFGLLLQRYGGDYSSRLEGPEFAPEKAMSLVDFHLVNSDGRAVERAEFQGQILLVNFVFTSCGATCFQVSRRLVELQQRLRDRTDVRIVSITIDPRSDTPSALTKFAGRLGAQRPQWTFLTGDTSEVEHVLDASFLPGFARAKRDPFQGILDTTRIALVDRDGRLRGFFDGLKTNAPDAIERVLAVVARER